jgi:hypothetical protein
MARFAHLSTSHFKQPAMRKHSFAISPRMRASFGLHVLPSEDQRAQGMPGAGCARSLACEIKKHTSVVTTVTPVSPDIPRATVYGLFRALPSDRAFLPLSFADSTRDLGASVGASGPHGFAVRLSAFRQERCWRPPHPASRP